MASVATYDEVKIQGDRNNDLYNGMYHRAYQIYDEMMAGELFEDDIDLVEGVIADLNTFLEEVKSDYRIHDQFSRRRKFNNGELKHYRTHFNNVKKGIEEELAKLQGNEIEPRGNVKQINAIHEQISALKAMKEQIDDQITALTKAL